MAKRPKSKKETSEKVETPAEDSTIDVAAPEDTHVADEAKIDDAQDVVEDIAEAQDDDTLSGAAEDDIIDAEPSAPVPEVIKETIVEHKAGFVPMVLGGVVAAGIGFVAAQQLYQDTGSSDLDQRITEQTTRIDDLTTTVDAIPSVDVSGVEAGVADAQSQISALADQLSALDAQVKELANRPVPNAEGAPTVDLTGVQTQIDALSALVDDQTGSLAQMVAAAQAEQANAEDAAKLTSARAAVTRILVAIENGAPFEDALAELSENSDVSVPASLVEAASTGAPTIGTLSEAYPAAAREALALARSEDTAGGIGSFLTRQLGARSVTPQEGDTPNAILSRMEAAVKEGRIEEALTDMDGLPDTAKAPLADWAVTANLRLTIAREADALATSLNSQ